MSQNISVTNGKRMRADIETLAQFGVVGTYEDVAKKYEVSRSTAYSYLKKLHKMAKEGKEKVVVITAEQPIKEEAKHTETQNHEVELEQEYTENLDETNELSEDLDQHVTVLEEQWKKPELTIEECWSLLESDIKKLHKMTIYRAEKQFQERLTGVIAEC